MTHDVALPLSQTESERSALEPPKRPRLWPAVAMVVLFWMINVGGAEMGLASGVRFLSRLAVSVLLPLAFAAWWLLQRRIQRRERLLAFGAAVLGGVLVMPLYHESVGGVWGLILVIAPFVITVWTIWLLLARCASMRTRLIGLSILLFLTWGAFALIRFNGASGEQVAEYHWRWTPTAEELYLAERAQRQATGGERGEVDSPRQPLRLESDDWPGFRGANRDGVVHGLKINTDWKAHPPKQLWKQRVGPGWSSLTVVGDRLFTQEQRGGVEAVVCLDAATGRERWSHEDAARFSEVVSGEGPRATPTFADGRIFTLGAMGILNCLDAASGARQWFRDIAADSGAKTPQWGFCSSPLVVNNVVVVFAGGDGDKGLLAYGADSGQLVWTAAAGQLSYSSPQRAVLNGQEQILFWSDVGLTAVDAVSGKTLWRHGVPSSPALRALQPNVAAEGQVLISSEMDPGTVFLDVKRDADSWTVSRRWTSKRLQPSFNDFVIHEGSIYGFDGALFCCVDLQTGGAALERGTLRPRASIAAGRSVVAADYGGERPSRTAGGQCGGTQGNRPLSSYRGQDVESPRHSTRPAVCA